MGLQGNRSESWVVLRCSLVRCCFNCGSNSLCFRGRSLYPNQICKGLKGLPYGKDRPVIIGMAIRKDGEQTCRIVTRQKVFFSPCQYAAVKSPDIQIHDLMPIDTNFYAVSIEIRIMIAFLPPFEPIYDFISIPYTGHPPPCRPTTLIEKLWYSREGTGDVTIKLFDPDEANVILFETKAHKLILTHSSPFFVNMFESSYKESIEQMAFLPWHKQTCLLFLQFCYFGNFPKGVLNDLGKNGFTIATELGLLASEYTMPQLLTATQNLCLYYASRDEINMDDIRGTLFQCLNIVRNGTLKFDNVFYLNLLICANLRLPRSDFSQENGLEDTVIKDCQSIDARIGEICGKTSRNCEICCEIERTLQRSAFNDLLM